MLWNALTSWQTSSKEERLVKAANVEQLGRDLITSWKRILGTEAMKYYCHILVAHVPDFIRRIPVDIMDASGSGIEQMNQIMKKIAG